MSQLPTKDVNYVLHGNTGKIGNPNGNPYSHAIQRLRSRIYKELDDDKVMLIIDALYRKAIHQTHPEQLKAAALLLNLLKLLSNNLDVEINTSMIMPPEDARRKVAEFFGLSMERVGEIESELIDVEVVEQK